jgi:hypothetical protein
MTLGEFRKATEGISDDYELEVYIPYEVIVSESGRGKPEKGSLVKSVEHLATKLVDDTVVISTGVTTRKSLVLAAQEEPECDVL